MMDGGSSVLIVNAGSSSIKTEIYNVADTESLFLEVIVEKIGLDGPTLLVRKSNTPEETKPLAIESYDEAVQIITETLQQNFNGNLSAIGHRIVHGGTRFNGPEVLHEQTISDLENLIPIDPDHMPGALKLIQALRELYADVPQVACFDTAFYAELPRIAQIIALPRKYESLGIRRYGFHGISYTYLLEEFSRLCGETASNGRVIFAHLGSGASLIALKNGKPVETTMGLSPASGVVMSTRSGDIDPAIPWQLHTQAGLEFEEINHLVTKESGLLGVSETSADMQQLLAVEKSDERAAEAVALFCYQVKKSIGSLAATIGGVDSIVFAGGIGEQAPLIRERILDGLDFLGIELNTDRNFAGEELISSDNSQVGVHVIHTDESKVILRQVSETLNIHKG